MNHYDERLREACEGLLKYVYEKHGATKDTLTCPHMKKIADILAHPSPVAPQGPTEVLVEALEKLARLGNGDRYGNSDGNIIAQEALSRYKAEKEEPLAVVAEKAGAGVSYGFHPEKKIRRVRLILNGVVMEEFVAPTYPEAEAKARAYLNGLPDKGGE